MSRRNVVSFYTAPARSGKTFRLVVRICDEILPLSEGVIYTNLPLNVDQIAEYCRSKYGLDVDVVRERLHIIPREVEHAWRDAGKPIYNPETGKQAGVHPLDGPWDYFNDKPLSGATVIIDEIHNFCGSIGTPKAVSNNWQKWLGELGHNQAIFVCISQAPEKVHGCIKQEAQASYTIRNTGLDRDPYFKIEVYDWLELWAGLFNQEYRIFVFEQETQKAEGRRKKGQRKLTLMGPPYFDFYDSFNKPIASEQTENVNPFEHEYEKHLRKGPVRGRLSLVRWFFFKNMQPLLSRGLMALAFAGVLAYMLTGGAGDVTHYISLTLADAFKKKGVASKSVDDEPVKPVEHISAEGAPDERIDLIRKTYEDELRKALTEKEKVEQELSRTKQELRNQSAVVMVTPTTVVLKKGHEYGIGDEIRSEEYKGKRLAKIDYRRREAVLDDGTILGIGR